MGGSPAKRAEIMSGTQTSQEQIGDFLATASSSVSPSQYKMMDLFDFLTLKLKIKPGTDRYQRIVNLRAYVQGFKGKSCQKKVVGGVPLRWFTS